MDQQELMKKVMEIQRDPSLTDEEKAIKRQELLAGRWAGKTEANDDAKNQGPSSAAVEDDDSLDDDTLKCAICMQLCERPVTSPCQHNFCLKCFQDLVAKAKKKACPSCRHEFSAKFAANPRVNTALISAIRAVKAGKKASAPKTFIRINNDDRPDEAFVTERAQRSGRANAASGRIMVNIPNDWFGPIPADKDPRGTGVLVGEFWKDRLDCRQWGAHFPHVAGIAGQSNVGAQSVVLSGGYEDDRDEGEWFLYTGSGGRDLSGNKRTNKVQSFDQEFTSLNKALKISCEKGYPVRVVRSHKEKRSAYAPTTEQPVRYDGVYRIVKCWRKKGAQGLLMCRYLFIRCDNEPAPWSSEEIGDKPRDLVKDLPKEAKDEMKAAHKNEIFSMNPEPHWDWDSTTKKWRWVKPPPPSQKTGGSGDGVGPKSRKKVSEHEKALRQMTCGLCKNILSQPVSAPCDHSFCKPCLDQKFGGQAFEHDVGLATGRSMRIRKVNMPCPCCKNDLADFLKTAQVNRGMEEMIVKLQKQVEAEKAAAAAEEGEEEEEVEEEEKSIDMGPASRQSTTPKKKGKQQKQQRSVRNKDNENISSTRTTPRSGNKNKKCGLAHTPTTRANTGHGNETVPMQVVGVACNAQSEADRRAMATAQLASDFPEFDVVLIDSLIEQEEGDVKAVKIALARLQAQMKAEENKRAKLAKKQKETQNLNIEKSPGGSASQPAKKGGSAVKRQMDNVSPASSPLSNAKKAKTAAAS